MKRKNAVSGTGDSSGTLACSSPTRRQLGVTLGAAILTGSGPSRAQTLTSAAVGASGDGIANETAALQRLFDRAQASGSEVRLSRGNCEISEDVLVRIGVSSVVGDGGSIRYKGESLNAGLLLAGPWFGDFANVERCRIEGVVIDAARRARPVAAIFAANVRRRQIVGNRIIGMRSGTANFVHGYAASGAAVEDVVIADNAIKGDTGEHGTEWWGIHATAELAFLEDITSQDIQWRRHYCVPDASVLTARCRIAGKKAMGGYYCIWLTAARNCTVVENVLRDNVCNITLQDDSRDNTETRNQCLESQSSSIHLAFGASDNLVLENRVNSARAAGEVLLHAYFGVERNRFVRNDVHSAGTPKYLAYCAIHAIENCFEGNRLRGKASRAFVALESAWDSSFDNTAYHMRGAAVAVSNVANRTSVGNSLVNQTIDGENDAPGLLLAQVGSEKAALRATRLVDNRVNQTRYRTCLELVEQSSAALSDIDASGNAFPLAARVKQFVLARGPAHFAHPTDNGVLDRFLDMKP